jgi:ankyrin repeat protein
VSKLEDIFTLLRKCNLESAFKSLTKLSVEDGFDANSLSSEGISLLNAAITAGSAPLVELLLNTGANPNLWDADGSPLGLAAGKGNLELCKKLFSAGADPNMLPIAGSTTPLAKASGRPASLPVLEWLLSIGADVDLPGINVKGLKSGTALSRAASIGNIEAVRLLLSAGADPNIIFASGTALSAAVENGEYEIAKLLLEADADKALAAPPSSGFPLADKKPLEIATIKKHQALIALLSDNAPATIKSVDLRSLVSDLVSRAEVMNLGLLAGATNAELSIFERQIEMKLPEILHELLKRCNGESEESDGMFPPPSGNPLDDAFLLMCIEDIEQARKFILDELNDKGRSLLPFGQDGLGDYLCVDRSDDSDSVIHLEHETHSRKLVSNSLISWLASLVDAASR